MGACCCGGDQLSKEDQARASYEKRMSSLLDQLLKDDMAKDTKTLNLLLLGAGESGKSTVMKQIQHIHGQQFDVEKRSDYLPVVLSNVILGMRTLLTMSDRLPAELQCRIEGEEEVKSKRWILDNVRMSDEITEEMARHFRRVWATRGLQNTYENRSRFQLNDTIKYFLDKIDEIAQPQYIPSFDDILRVRARTTGIVQTQLEVDRSKFLIIDVGGQRNERKKWIHCFENVTAVIFVAAINEYDQVLYEDLKTNRIQESLALFEDVCSSRWFRESAIVLFLNKADLFSVKINHVSLRVAFPEYDGPDYSFDAALDFLVMKFHEQNRSGMVNSIYTHVTTATDTQNIKFTFNAVKDFVIQQNLKRCGLLADGLQGVD